MLRSSASVLRRLHSVRMVSQVLCRHQAAEMLGASVMRRSEWQHQQHVRQFSSDPVTSIDEGGEGERYRLVGPTEVEEQHNEMKRIAEVPLHEVLKAKHSFRWVEPVIDAEATVEAAIVTCIQGGLSGMMVTEKKDDNHVVGLITSRDLLRILSRGISEGEEASTIMMKKVGDHMTAKSQIVYARPDETIGKCRTIMAKLGIKCIPVLSKDGEVDGLITARDITDYATGVRGRGGKKNYLTDVSTRVGLGNNTSMADPPAYIQAHLALEQTPLFTNIGVAEYPHPFKADINSGVDHRAYSPEELSTDPELSEDAHFVSRVRVPDEKGFEMELTYVGVADGVGSWREYGVDPKLFSHRLMEECENFLHETNSRSESKAAHHIVAPVEMLAQAYRRVKAANIIGSSTACVAVIDNLRHQLHFSNLGDSGIIVLRHIDSDVAGSLKRMKIPRAERKSDLRVAFVSQQQLRSFNHPYQLGWTGNEIPEEEDNSFKNAKDACTSSIHIRRGDIVIMATDGLFDNVHLEEIEAMALDWEQKCGFIRGGDISAREKRWAMGNSLTSVSAEQVGTFALDLCKRARLNSLDATRDSPFAVLAKDNDIMWSGGMPDDCTVVVMHIVGRSAEDVMDKDRQ